MRVEIEQRPGEELLRSLVADSLDQLLGPFQLIDAELPVVGRPLLVLDGQKQLVVVGFDAGRAERALQAAAAATTELAALRKWWTRLYPGLPAEAVARPLRMMLLVPADAYRTGSVLAEHPRLRIQPFRVLRVDGIPALLLEPNSASTPAETETTHLHGPLASEPDEDGPLSAEESEFFRQI